MNDCDCELEVWSAISVQKQQGSIAPSIIIITNLGTLFQNYSSKQALNFTCIKRVIRIILIQNV